MLLENSVSIWSSYMYYVQNCCERLCFYFQIQLLSLGFLKNALMRYNLFHWHNLQMCLFLFHWNLFVLPLQHSILPWLLWIFSCINDVYILYSYFCFILWCRMYIWIILQVNFLLIMICIFFNKGTPPGLKVRIEIYRGGLHTV